MSVLRTASALAVAGALLAAGCGGDDAPAVSGGDPAATQTATVPAAPPAQEPAATSQEAPPPPVTVTATAPAPAPTAPEEAPGGAGDEEGAVARVRFTIDGDGALSPRAAQLPAFLNGELTVDNQDDAAHQLDVGDRGAPLPAGRTTTLTLPGRAATELPVVLDGEQVAVLQVVAERP